MPRKSKQISHHQFVGRGSWVLCKFLFLTYYVQDEVPHRYGWTSFTEGWRKLMSRHQLVCRCCWCSWTSSPQYWRKSLMNNWSCDSFSIFLCILFAQDKVQHTCGWTSSCKVEGNDLSTFMYYGSLCNFSRNSIVHKTESFIHMVKRHSWKMGKKFDLIGSCVMAVYASLPPMQSIG